MRLSALYVSVFVKAHWLLRFSGQCLTRPLLVVSTCVQFKQGAILSPECVFSPPYWHVWQTWLKWCLDQSLDWWKQDFSYFWHSASEMWAQRHTSEDCLIQRQFWQILQPLTGLPSHSGLPFPHNVETFPLRARSILLLCVCQLGRKQSTINHGSIIIEWIINGAFQGSTSKPQSNVWQLVTSMTLLVKNHQFF